LAFVIATRLVTLDDAARIARLLTDSQAFLARWEPVRGEEYFTPEGQRAFIEAALDGFRRGTSVPHVILDDSGQVAGRITLNSIVRGPFQSCSVGYWVAAAAGGRGLATRALGAIKHVAFGEMGLHRIEAGTLVHNVRSQKVLLRNGFVRFGLAPSYLKIAGKWQDHILFQVLSGS
jgi:[ribosomal protein S5]-alanine N-acetyltransferase